MADISNKKRVRVDSDEPELELDSPEVKRLRDDLLSNLDESDFCATSSDLDSFMRSFEKEISAYPAPVIDLTSDSGDGESYPDLGFLLGADDDELGLPPATDERVMRNSEAGLSELWRFEDELPSYDSFEYGHSYEYNDLGFDYWDSGLDFYDAPLPLWRPETMPAANFAGNHI